MNPDEKSKYFKTKLSLEHATKAYKDSRGTAPLMLNLGARMAVSGLTTCPGRFSPTESQMPTKQEVGWTPETAWTFWRRKKNPFLPPGFEFQTVQPVASSLYRLR
jgi:hypothetical protein